MILLNGKPINVTIFPDKTSQVWKLDEELLKECKEASECQITWEFEHEGEIMHLIQLRNLLNEYIIDCVNLHIPYFPYARQDKMVSNKTTFALRVFMNLLRKLKFNKITVIDVHNPMRFLDQTLFENIIPFDRMKGIICELGINRICFPDEGASNRYTSGLSEFHYCSFNKVRNQETGVIEKMEIDKKIMDAIMMIDRTYFYNKKVLIIDDICDGGATFIMMAKELKELGVADINLYVTHGIFSKGTQVLKDAGISRIFTYKGEVL